MHFLLLNPPGRLSYSRDYFCSKVTKAGYAEHPVDLLILSGIISSAGHKVTLIDAIAEGIDFATTRQRIDSLGVDVIIFLSGTTSWKDDFAFLQQLRQARPNIFLIGLGDIFLDKEAFINNKWIDAVILDFTRDEFLRYLNKDNDCFESLYFRRQDEIYIPPRQKSVGEFIIPVPRHELFLNKRYSFPFARDIPFATVLTDYGCSSACPFCIYPTLGFKLRELNNVFDELKYIRSLGIKELFIKDQSFGVDKQRTVMLCQGMRQIGGFSWSCFLRTDIATPEMLSTMKMAGCHTVIFGVESASDSILRKYKPGVNRKNIEEAFRACRLLGIETVGIFILGFPEDEESNCLDTINYSLQLECDYASFNVFVPKVETPVRKSLTMGGVVHSDNPMVLDQSGIASLWHTVRLSQQQLGRLRRLALRRFYLRPSYVIKRLFKMQSSSQIGIFVKSALFILRDLCNMFNSSKNKIIDCASEIEYTKCAICGDRDTLLFRKGGPFNIVRCRKCDLIYVNPRPKRLIEQYNRNESSPFNYYLRNRRADIKTAHEILMLISQYKKRGKLLDVGCATGSLLSVAKNMGYGVTGIDINRQSVEFCRRELSLDVRYGSLDAVPAGEMFDIVVLADVIEHLSEPLSMLRQINKILSEGSIIFISTPNITSWATRMFQVKPEEHLYYFDTKTMKNILNRAGFRTLILDTFDRWRDIGNLVYSSTFKKRPVMRAAFRLLRTLFIHRGILIKLPLKENLLVIAEKV